MSGKLSEAGAIIGANAQISRRHAMALGAGVLAVSVLPLSAMLVTAEAGQMSDGMHAALGDFLEANCRYHQAYRALPTERMAITPRAVGQEWMSANVELRRAVEAVMNVPCTSAEDVRMKMRVKDVFFMKECPPESHWAGAEALRWNALIDREAAVFGVASPIANPVLT